MAGRTIRKNTPYELSFESIMSGNGGHYTSRAASEAEHISITNHIQDMSIAGEGSDAAPTAVTKAKSPRPRPAAERPVNKPADLDPKGTSKPDKPAEPTMSVPGGDFEITAQERREFRTDTINYDAQRMIGHGSFGAVFQARVVETNEIVAIKKVLQDKRFKNRELQIMRQLSHQQHPFVVMLKHFFVSKGSKPGDVYLNLVLEYVPETVYSVGKHYHRLKQSVPIGAVRLYMYQLSRALAHIHGMGICHRDIKPQNLLVDPAKHTLKLCDFGSAKVLVKGEPNVAYICSRYYRAPELIFGAMDYTTMIDVWSQGCVFAELLIGSPLFPGSSGIDQLVEIIKILGTPTKVELKAMNPNYQEFKFPQIRANPWGSVFKPGTSAEAIDLVGKMLSYIPTDRTRAIDACVHPFFDDIRAPGATTHEGTPIHEANFQFTPEELTGVDATLLAQLSPAHVQQSTAPPPTSMASIPEDIEISGGLKEGKVKTDASADSSEGPKAPDSTPYSSLNHEAVQGSIHRNTVVALPGDVAPKL